MPRYSGGLKTAVIVFTVIGYASMSGLLRFKKRLQLRAKGTAVTCEKTKNPVSHIVKSLTQRAFNSCPGLLTPA